MNYRKKLFGNNYGEQQLLNWFGSRDERGTTVQSIVRTPWTFVSSFCRVAGARICNEYSICVHCPDEESTSVWGEICDEEQNRRSLVDAFKGHACHCRRFFLYKEKISTWQWQCSTIEGVVLAPRSITEKVESLFIVENNRTIQHIILFKEWIVLNVYDFIIIICHTPQVLLAHSHRYGPSH